MDIEMKQQWNQAADHFQKILHEEEDYAQKLVGFLRSEGALTDGCRVADIGCGVGKYALKFADYGCELLLVDIADNMLQYARENLQQRGVTAQQVICDWADTDLDAMGWTASADLVFASMTPAVQKAEDLEKLCRMSKKYCFVSKFLSRRNRLLEKAAERCGIQLQEDHREFDQSMEILQWVLRQGCLPKVQFEPYDWVNVCTPEEAKQRILSSAQKDQFAGIDLDSVLEQMAQPDGTVLETVEAGTMWLLWDVTSGTKD